MLAPRPTRAGCLVLQLRQREAEIGCDVQETLINHSQRYSNIAFPPFCLSRSRSSPLRFCMPDLDILRTHLTTLGRVVLGYSGGVDSGLLAVVARQTLGSDRFLAVTGRSASYPAVQSDRALQLAERFDVPVL